MYWNSGVPYNTTMNSLTNLSGLNTKPMFAKKTNTGGGNNANNNSKSKK